MALIAFALVAGVVAARALEAGTKLSLADVEVVQVHAGAVLESAFETPEDVVSLVITVQRLPGDQVTADMVGDAAQNALAQALAVSEVSREGRGQDEAANMECGETIVAP